MSIRAISGPLGLALIELEDWNCCGSTPYGSTSELESLCIAARNLALAEKIVTVATWLWNAALMANPIVWIIAGVLALVAAVILVIKYWDKIWGAISGFFSWLHNKLQDVPDWLLVAFPFLLIIKHWDTITRAISGFFSWLWNTIQKVWGWIRKVASDMPDWFIAAIAIIGGPIGWFISAILFIAKHWEKVKEIVGIVWDYVAEFFSDMKELGGIVIDWLVDKWSVFADSMKIIWEGLKTAFVTSLFGMLFSILLKYIYGSYEKKDIKKKGVLV